MAVLSTLPKALRRALVRHMNSARAYMMLVDADQFCVNYDDYWALRSELQVRRALRLGGRLLPIFEVGEQQVLAKTFIHLGGVDLPTLQPTPCPFCGKPVLHNAAGCCPECGGVLGGG